MLASIYGKTDCVELLLKAGADTDIKDNVSETLYPYRYIIIDCRGVCIVPGAGTQQ